MITCAQPFAAPTNHRHNACPTCTCTAQSQRLPACKPPCLCSANPQHAHPNNTTPQLKTACSTCNSYRCSADGALQETCRTPCQLHVHTASLQETKQGFLPSACRSFLQDTLQCNLQEAVWRSHAPTQRMLPSDPVPLFLLDVHIDGAAATTTALILICPAPACSWA